MADVALRFVGRGAQSPTTAATVRSVIPPAFADDSNLTAVVLAYGPAASAPGRAGSAEGKAGPGAKTFDRADFEAADAVVRLSVSANSSVHLASPTNVDYGFLRLLEERLAEAGGPAGLRVLPTLNTTFLAPAARVIIRLPRQPMNAWIVPLKASGIGGLAGWCGAGGGLYGRTGGSCARASKLAVPLIAHAQHGSGPVVWRAFGRRPARRPLRHRVGLAAVHWARPPRPGRGSRYGREVGEVWPRISAGRGQRGQATSAMRSGRRVGCGVCLGGLGGAARVPARNRWFGAGRCPGLPR